MVEVQKGKNKKVFQGKGGTTTPISPGTKGDWFLIDNPDPAHLITRVYLHGDDVTVIDNIPIEKAKNLFEQGLQKTDMPEIAVIKNKVENDKTYEPSEQDVETLKDWAKNPEIFLDEGQLQKIYDFEQGSIWDFFIDAQGIKKIPTLLERIERGFDSYVKTYTFNDNQMHILNDLKDIVAANIIHKKKLTPMEIFDNPVYSRIIGVDYPEVNSIFNNCLPQVFEELQTTFRV
ncbi:MAG: hypothetical protein HQK89_04030 [Nitrospirae bacterium]|nr:hypothetical protein [Nitrospirota bacterium]